MLAQMVKPANTRENGIKCSNDDCATYAHISLSKINVFVSLIGLVLEATATATFANSGVLIQSVVLALAIAHFSMVVANNMSSTRCAKSLGWHYF